MLINAQSLNDHKLHELTNLVKENSLLCITETHQKHRTITVPDSYSFIDQMRDPSDKKGGGLMLIHKKNSNITATKHQTNNPDTLIVEVSYKNFTMSLMLVYCPTNNPVRYLHVMKEIDNFTSRQDENSNYTILGDFNAHLGLIGPQPLNNKGQQVLDLMERYNLILLNNDLNSVGETTWECRGQKSAIDFILTNHNLHQKFSSLEVDEAKQHYDLSDHNLLIANFIVHNEHTRPKKQPTKETYFYSTKDEDLKMFGEKVADTLNEENTKSINHTIEQIENTMISIAEVVLKKRKRGPPHIYKDKLPWFSLKIEKKSKNEKP